MNSTLRWFVSITLTVFTVLLIMEGIQLWSLGANVDGNGMGVYFLGMEINDKVPEGNIPSYAIGFFIAALCTLLLAIIPFGNILFHSESKRAI